MRAIVTFSVAKRARRGRAAKGFFVSGAMEKVYRGVYLRLYKSCIKICILAASKGWEAHRRRTAVFISRENAVFGPKKIDYGWDDLLKHITLNLFTSILSHNNNNSPKVESFVSASECVV